MSSLTITFWSCLIIANVWMATGAGQAQEIFWICLALASLVADLLIKYKSVK